MMSFYLSGGVEVLGFISPTEPTDEYPVIDPLYGIDGFRNVNTLSELNSIPNLRRRAGMVVGVSGGTQYYKLNPQPWNGTITDWDTFSLGGGTFTGGTVTGNTVFIQGITATTFSASTYLGLPLDVFVTGGTYSNGTLTFTNNSGGTFNVVGLNTGTTINLSGGTGISISGTSPDFIIDNTLPDQIVSLSGGTNIHITGTYPNFGVEFTGVTSGSFTGGTVTGDTIFTQGITATTFSAATYLGLPLDVYVTGGTYSNGTLTFTNNSGGTFNVIGLYTGGTDFYVTGGTFNKNTETLNLNRNDGNNVQITGFTDIFTTGFTFNPSTYEISIEQNDGVILTQNLGILATDVTITGGTYDPLNGSITFVNNTGGTFTVTGFITGFTDIQVTGYTYQDNTFTISDSSGNTFSAIIDVMTGLTVNGLLSATTLNVNGVNITGDTYTTGGTYSNGTLDFYNNNGGSYQVTGLYTGQTSYVNSLTTSIGLSGDSTTGNITIINTDPDQIVTISGGTGILTGGTYPNFTIQNTLPDQTVVLNNGTNISVTGTYPNFTIDVTGLTDNNTYTTGFTYQDNTFTISDSSGNTLNATINSVTGLTVNGILSASTISGGTLYGDGSNLTGLSTGLNVGTTQITNGTDTRVLFQSGTTLQQDGNFTFNPTLKRLTLKAIGAGTSDTPFIIQNSTGTVNLLEQNGVGSLLARSNDTFSYLGLFYRSDGANGWTLTNSHSGFGLGTGIETVGNNLYFLTTGTRALSVSTQGTGTFKTYGIWNYGSGSGQRLLIGENVFDPQLTLSGLGNLGLGTYSAGARLDVRAQGALSTDIVFRVRNSADTLDILQVRGDTRIIQNITTNSATTYAGFNVAGENTDTYVNAVVSGNQPMGVGFRARSGNGGNSITVWTDNGNVSGVGSASSHLWSASIGYTYFGAMGTNSLGFKFGYSGAATLSNSTGMLGMLIRSNVSTNQSIFSLGTYLGTTTSNPSSNYGGNTFFIASGTAPTATEADSFCLYSADRGGTAGRASAHFRSEDGTINVLGDRTGINTSTPQARLHVANADTTLTTGLFSGTGQNILTVIGSGNTTSPSIFTVQGSSGELFSVSDSLVGSLFSVNDISGLPILEVFSDNTTLMGSYLAPSLNTTTRVIATTGTTNVYSIPTSAYTGAFFDYTVSDGTNLRAGNIMSIWSGTSVNITETQTTDFGNTSGLTFNMVVSSGNAILRTSGTTGNWTVKTIVRSI